MQSPQGKKLFVFDRVFNEHTNQEGIWEYLSDSVSSFVKGYNVSILAYGQSGSGKSYTMGTSGPEDQDNPKIMGIVPRAAQVLFDKLTGTTLPKSGLQTPKRYSTQALPTIGGVAKAVSTGVDKNWTLKATYVEIYQEQLRDLLIPESIPMQDRATVAIREDTKGRILVTGLTQVTINSVDDLLFALNFGSAIRQTDATNINARSSRSHAVFSLNLIQKKSETPTTPKQEKRFSVPVESLSGTENLVTIDSKLHFVDLAGSERLKNTGATGDRAKEGISINAGLASLGKVISQLSSKHGHAHISYRDSRLTRLLQDSLGGNAITFMVACVTPAVFHLSETLNTVHYAQRARAIQSKPEIQQTRDDGDKQAAIDRLRAEVSFLRDQIRHSEHAEGKGLDGRSRSEKHRGKEAELETQLMDIQENYNALSSRHAKLIAELSSARDGENPEMPLLDGSIGDNAMERIKRSSSFAEAVEQMVLEYEKTIQSLESSLSKTRSSLSSSESTLLEKETRIAYMETIQQQLQARIQKAMDREQNNEAYLHDLEMRIQGTTSGEEKNAALISELRKELARMREGESSNEDYISTLEERLAETEQDQEIMEREIDRLEHVVERQRSIGRLDNLLGELDTIRKHDTQAPNGHGPTMNGHRESYDPFESESRSASSAAVTRDDDFEDAGTDFADYGDAVQPLNVRSATEDAIQQSRALAEAHTTTQDDFMADKVENLTQELFDLRSEHESVMTDYDKLQQKYQTALETLAKLEYDKETKKLNESRGLGQESSFLAEAGMKEEEKADAAGQPSSSRSLSAELSLQQELTSSYEDLKEKTDTKRVPMIDRVSFEMNDVEPTQVPLPDNEDEDPELEKLRDLNAQNEVTIADLTANYQSLHARHEETLAQVEDLKQELTRSQSLRPTSPTFKQTFFKRKSHDEFMTMHGDRASKSITSLKSIAQDNLEQSPDICQSFQTNLNSVLIELNNRSERVQSLEAELATTKKEMESKQTIIAGLTRERSSLKASLGVDFSVVSQMREQLLEGETRIRALQEQNAAREKEFQDQIESLKAQLGTQANLLPTPAEEKTLGIPGAFAATLNTELTKDQAVGGSSAQIEEQAEVIERLRSELAAWETKHQDAVEYMKATERKLLGTIEKMEESLRIAETSKPLLAVPSSATSDFEEERSKHREVVEALQRQVEEYKSTANDHVTKLEQLEASYAEVLQQVNEDARCRDLNSQELETHKGLVTNLENQLQVHKSAIAIHQESLESLQASHSKELEDLNTSMTTTQNQSAERYATLEAQYKQVTQNLERELVKAQNDNAELLRNASSALGCWTDPSKLHSQIKGLVEEGKELHTRHLKTTNELKSVQEELQGALNKHVDLESKIGELTKVNEESIKELERSMEKEKKSSRLVDELEEQLNSNYDSHHQSMNKRSSPSELERELESQKAKNQALEVSFTPTARERCRVANTSQKQLEVLHRQSAQSNGSGNLNRESLSPDPATAALGRNGSGASQGRKSNGTTALPTPPPSIPLPPLPNSPVSGTPQIPNGIDGRANSPPLRRTSPIPSTSPPGSRHTSNEVPPGTSQQLEEQETRIRTIEKHLYAEKQLTATLEEALVDLETSANRTKVEMETWRKKCTSLEEELSGLRKERTNSRASLQAVEEEREMRLRAEKARHALEERMKELNATKKTKKSTLNCF